jgi:hypothetical protein
MYCTRDPYCMGAPIVLVNKSPWSLDTVSTTSLLVYKLLERGCTVAERVCGVRFGGPTRASHRLTTPPFLPLRAVSLRSRRSLARCC